MHVKDFIFVFNIFFLFNLIYSNSRFTHSLPFTKLIQVSIHRVKHFVFFILSISSDNIAIDFFLSGSFRFFFFNFLCISYLTFLLWPSLSLSPQLHITFFHLSNISVLHFRKYWLIWNSSFFFSFFFFIFFEERNYCSSLLVIVRLVVVRRK